MRFVMLLFIITTTLKRRFYSLESTVKMNLKFAEMCLSFKYFYSCESFKEALIEHLTKKKLQISILKHSQIEWKISFYTIFMSNRYKPSNNIFYYAAFESISHQYSLSKKIVVILNLYIINGHGWLIFEGPNLSDRCRRF